MVKMEEGVELLDNKVQEEEDGFLEMVTMEEGVELLDSMVEILKVQEEEDGFLEMVKVEEGVELLDNKFQEEEDGFLEMVTMDEGVELLDNMDTFNHWKKTYNLLKPHLQEAQQGPLAPVPPQAQEQPAQDALEQEQPALDVPYQEQSEIIPPAPQHDYFPMPLPHQQAASMTNEELAALITESYRQLNQRLDYHELILEDIMPYLYPTDHLHRITTMRARVFGASISGVDAEDLQANGVDDDDGGADDAGGASRVVDE